MGRRVILDVSSFQPGVIDWGRIKRESGGEVVGGIEKATEGVWKYSNPGFESQVDGLHAAGMAAGAYCFVHPEFGGTSDAQMFLDRIAGRKLELGVFQDVEVDDGVDPGTLLARVMEDQQLIESRYPGHSGIYTADWFWGPHTLGSVAANVQRFPLWVAGYLASLPMLPVPWRSALLWQFTDKYPTYFGACDASVFLGDDAAWAKWTGLGTATPVVVHKGVDIRGLQSAVHAMADGIFGPDTDKRCEAVRVMTYGGARFSKAMVRYLQLVMAFPPAAADGIWGPVTESHWHQTIASMQRALGVAADGNWGPITDHAYLLANPLR